MNGARLVRYRDRREMADRPLRADPELRARDNRDNRRRRPRETPARRKRRGRLGRVVKFLVLMGLWVGIVGACVLGYFAVTLPDTGQLTIAERRPSVTIVAADGGTIASMGDLFGEPLTLKEIAPDLTKAVIATEDRRFYSHFGIDPIGMLRAAISDLHAGHIVQGGSTITQQLAKIAFLTPERSFTRKIRETLMALWLERHFTKNQILEIYLNRVYLGAGAYGVDAAAHRYFGKSARNLNLFECAVIAGLLKAPTRFSPAHDRDKAQARAAQVLDNMVDAGYITQAQAAAAEKEGPADTARAAERPGSHYFADWIADQVRDFAGTSDRDLIVTTTFDPRLQAAAEAAIDDTIVRNGQKDAVSQGALVAMSPDGAVRAMVGGRNYGDSQFNRATQAERQPGSSFKPFVYLAGLEAGLRPDDHFVDQPIRVGNWQPRNYTGRYLGDMTMAEGLAESINTIAVQVAQRAGIPNVVAVANRLGITSRLTPDASIALGTDEVNLLELVSAYAPFRQWRHRDHALRHRPDPRHERQGPLPALRRRSRASGLAGRRRADERDAARRRQSRHRPRRPPAAPRRRQDRHDPGLSRRLVYRLHGEPESPGSGSATTTTPRCDASPAARACPPRAWHNFMLAATSKLPVEPLPSAQPGTPPGAPSPLDNLITGLGLANGTPVPPPPTDSLPGPAAVSDTR